MKVGDKVKTWTNNLIGTVKRIYSDGTVDVAYKGSNVIDNLPVKMCIKVNNNF